MDYGNVIEVQFNWHQHPEHGSDFGFYRVGEEYLRFRGGIARCESIEIDWNDGMHAIISFGDGTVEHQWNLNKIIEAEPDYGDGTPKNNQADNEAPGLPQPRSPEAQI